MNDLEKNLDTTASLANMLYASYAGRDFFAKVIPGFVVIVSTLYLLSDASIILSHLKDIPFMAWVLLFGVFYAAGFTIQRLGETLCLKISDKRHCFIHLYGTGWDSEMYKKKVEEFFREAPLMYHRAQRERYVVIKELYGNLAVSLTVVPLVLAAQTAWTVLTTEWCNVEKEVFTIKVFTGVVLGLSIWSLVCGNRKICDSEKNWINNTIAGIRE